MGFLGLLTLGVFVGTLLCAAIRKITNGSDAIKVVSAMLATALSGIVFTFIEKMMGTTLGPALFMYPVGLAYSLLWLYSDHAIENVRSPIANQQIVGWLHICGMVLGTALVLLLLLSKSFRNLLPVNA